MHAAVAMYADDPQKLGVLGVSNGHPELHAHLLSNGRRPNGHSPSLLAVSSTSPQTSLQGTFRSCSKI